ncbi:Mitochondrial presequence protease [Savitreella phatthalungensis]
MLRAARTRLSLLNSRSADGRLKRLSRSLSVAIHPASFTLADRIELPELDLEAFLYRHEQTGLEHLHISRSDANNVFSVGFATPPKDFTGLPHILEHIVLCGSKAFPVRDPFFKMLNRSLATYMNAFTAVDHTFYPFSTVNETDYSNLRDVYLDATFRPRLLEADFRQEGWRLEHVVPSDASSPLELKGVVYNEMKGQMSDSAYWFLIAYTREMFRGTIYGNDSGGDPLAIPTLTHGDLVDYHRRHYQPSNAKVYTYGSFNPRHTQTALIDMLEGYTPDQPVSPDVFKLRLHSRGRVDAIGPFDELAPENRQLRHSLSYICNPITDAFETFAMRILSTLLLDGHGAPFYESLIQNGLGSDFAPNTGYDTSAPVTVFTIGLQGVQEAQLDQVRQTISDTMQKVTVEGFSTDKIEGVLHQIEIAQKRRSANFGMNLLNTLSGPWIKGVPISELLVWNSNVQRLRASLAQGPFFQDLMRKYLMREPDLDFVMRPGDFHKTRMRAEQENLEHKAAASDSKRILAEAAELQTLQNQEEDLTCLPTLTTADIPVQGRHTSLEKYHDGDILVYRNSTLSGVTYIRLLIDLHMPVNLLPYLPLYSECLLNLGTKSSTMSELEDKIRLKTGGFTSSTFAVDHPDDLNRANYGIVLAGHALDANASAMIDLMSEMLEPDFANEDKLAAHLRMQAAGLTSAVADSGHHFAQTAANASLTPSAALNETFGGLSQVRLIARLAANPKEALQPLKAIHDYVRVGRRRVLLTGIAADVSCLAPSPAEFHGELDAGTDTDCEKGLSGRLLYETPYDVDYASYALLGFPYTDARGPPMQVAAKLLTNKFLHKEIREKGGAYGGGASYNKGILSFYSYRDPDGLRSIKTMARSCDWLLSQTLTVRDLDEAKLALFQAIDMPVALGSEGATEFMSGLSAEIRQRRRERLLGVTLEDVRQSAMLMKQSVKSSAILRRASLGQVDGWQLRSFLQDKPDSPQIPSDQREAMKPVTDSYGQCHSNPLHLRGSIATIEITQGAQDRLNQILQASSCLRVSLEPGGCHGYQYKFSIDSHIEDDDCIIARGKARLVVDHTSLELMEGSKLDFAHELIGAEFKIIDNPRATSSCGCDISISINTSKKGSVV